ncbi:LLM class flavin-dependent oxidoreductase [Streptomyces albus subsp. chlorinus]|uniref:LLM class flavin-dependent oxidoreductase n=1 Tax=Streptomyces albus TaxID=1888 RepID=UPI0015704685|nr:LLM class flavin-dependent oxidoreductase [Streptomyces albus]NSC23946.1 LLM class flavin-dependent oxidoreductase [Streptomyces albus subsp. chlorinus]
MRVGAFVLGAQFPGQGQGEALERAVRAGEAAEEAGLADVWLAEHHFVSYGVCPSAVTFAALLLGRTRRIGVGTAISVLPNAHPVALGEQAALLHLLSGGRFTLGVGRGGPWVDLEVFGGGLPAFEEGFPEALDLLLRWLREPRVGADGERYRFREVQVVPRADCAIAPGGAAADDATADGAAPSGAAAPASGAGPGVVVACTSPGTVRLAAARLLPMLVGMHCGDEEKAEMTRMWRREALAAGHPSEEVEAVAGRHVSAGVVQVGESHREAREALVKAMPGWLREGLGQHVTVDGRARRMRDPQAYTELLCDLHPVGAPRLCADRLAATAERSGIGRFALLVEGTGDRDGTMRNIHRLGDEVLPLLA